MSEKKPLPPDPDGRNDARANDAEAAIRAYMEACNCDREDALDGLLMSLLHWADRNDDPFKDALEWAQVCYADQTRDPNAKIEPPMTPEEFLEQYPDSEERVDLLYDMACPKCGYRNRFKIEATSLFYVEEDGSNTDEDIEWEDTSRCYCPKCDHAGTVKEFTIEGLDDAINELNSECNSGD